MGAGSQCWGSRIGKFIDQPAQPPCQSHASKRPWTKSGQCFPGCPLASHTVCLHRIKCWVLPLGGKDGDKVVRLATSEEQYGEGPACIIQAGLQLIEIPPPASASRVWGLSMCSTMPSLRSGLERPPHVPRPSLGCLKARA